MYDYEQEKKRLTCKIAYLEDKLLRSKDPYKIMQLQSDLGKLRADLQKLQWKMYR